ncbi:MAG: divalent-cation tolerance protein CutA [Candidatus Micrarchaeota archaeon]
MILVLTTLPSYAHADRLASSLVDARLAACASILRIDRSYYMWKGRTVRAPELLLIIKTRKASYAKVEAFIRKSHPHKCPEIAGIPASRVSRGYRKWLYSETK